MLGREPTLLKSATRGQCDARPTVTFPAVRHRRSSTTQYPFILLGERVLRTTCLRLVPESGTDRSGTGDLRVASPLHRVAGLRGRIATVCRTGSAGSITRSTGSIREVLPACMRWVYYVQSHTCFVYAPRARDSTRLLSAARSFGR